MVDRHYLPYPLAQTYQDRKMAKWMGFFLSEHTTALHQDETILMASSHLSPEERLLLLNQAFLQELEVDFFLEKEVLRGKIISLTTKKVSIALEEGRRTLPLTDIYQLQLA